MRLKIVPLLFLTLCSLPCFAQTFMIVATEIRDGEQLSRPFPSQEGMIEGMFDSGFVSFDTGLYAPEVDWREMDFREPLEIARQGLARYLLAAEVRSITEPRDPKTLPPDTGESPAPAAGIIWLRWTCLASSIRQSGRWPMISSRPCWNWRRPGRGPPSTRP